MYSVYYICFTIRWLVHVCVFMCSYVERYDLQEPSDDIQYVLKRIAVKLKKTQRIKAITGVGKKENNSTLNTWHISVRTEQRCWYFKPFI